MEDFDTYYGLEDFITEELDFYLLLRLFCEAPENRGLLLQWEHFDLIESGWCSLEDLTDIDRRDLIVNHTKLFGQL